MLLRYCNVRGSSNCYLDFGLMYLERPIYMDVVCSGNHATYDAHKKHKLARARIQATVPMNVFYCPWVALRYPRRLNFVARLYLMG
jgi:hypothetical protein